MVHMYVTVVKTEDEQIYFSQQQLQKEVETIFVKAILTLQLLLHQQPPLSLIVGIIVARFIVSIKIK